MEGKKERGDGRADDRRLCSRLGLAVEASVRIPVFELLDGPPGGGGVDDAAAPAFPHPRVENTDHMTLAIEPESPLAENGPDCSS